ncbi:MAG: hypothetical protein KKA16_07210 [Alphaproteobacteria bacterium]|nr:hypothetical protein [Alphaproteobacteria bacterium]MBU2379626.1 hypothetical protein [Alphaproteobacteria bacterium]
MRDLSPAEIAHRQFDELISNLRIYHDRHQAMSDRWAVSLAVANAGALLALASRILSASKEAEIAFLMPSCWMFTVGLLSIGIAQPIRSRRQGLSAQIWDCYLKQFRRGLPLTEPTDIENPNGRLLTFENRLEWASAALFAGALVYPLATLCMRYLTSGAGFLP